MKLGWRVERKYANEGFFCKETTLVTEAVIGCRYKRK